MSGNRPSTIVSLFLLLLCVPYLSLAEKDNRSHFVLAQGDRVDRVVGASGETHRMVALAMNGNPNEFINDDLGTLTIDDNPCVYTAISVDASTPSLASPPESRFEVDVECFDMVAQKERRSFLYAADAYGILIVGVKPYIIGEYAQAGSGFDLAAWQWISGHLSKSLARRIDEDRQAGRAQSEDERLHPPPRPGGDITPPRLVKSVDATYSDAGRRNHIEGTCVVSLFVDANGSPQHVRVTAPLGYGMDENAIMAIRQYRFRPSTLHGNPVPVSVKVEVNFHYPR